MMRLTPWLVLSVCSAAAASTASAPTALTECGEVSGVVEGAGISVFKGIPYAAPPVLARRWRPPVALGEAGLCWGNGTTQAADTFGATCPQQPGSMHVEHTDEDCLFVNVWTPALPPLSRLPRLDPTRARARARAATTAPLNPRTPALLDLLPVMVWIHGGGYVFGSGNYPNYAPTPDQASGMGAVLVSLNYRLGPFGWLATAELSADNLRNNATRTRTSGNYGYMDMIAALRWVRRNIAAFGGDPNKVTLYGQSAGGTAVMALMAAPSAAGLFHRALMQSGSARYNTSLAQAEADNAYFMGAAGCAGRGVACLRAAPTATIIDAIRWTEYPGWGGGGVSGFPIANFSWGNLAIVDGHVIPAAPVDVLASGAAPVDVPIIVASTAQETDLFPLTNVRDLSWEAYVSLARTKMAPFGEAAVNATLAYDDSGVPCFSGGARCPEVPYSSLSSDIGVNCPQNVIAAQIARRGRPSITPSGTSARHDARMPATTTTTTTATTTTTTTTSANGAALGRGETTTVDATKMGAAPSKLYRTVLTASPSHPMYMFCDPAVAPHTCLPAHYAFHTLDSIYLFNTTRGAMGGITPTAADNKLTQALRKAIGSFIRTGEIESWQAYPEATMVVGDAGAVREIAGDYHAEQCEFWETHGFWKYSWAGN